MNFLKKIGIFASCLLQENCDYSIKKILSYIFSLLVVYVVIFTDKEYYELLFFIGGLLGVRAYERVQLWKTPPGVVNSDPIQDPDTEPGLGDDSVLGSKKPTAKNSKKRLLTD